MNRDLLGMRLEQTFESSAAERRVVVRQAGDLHDSGRYADTHDVELSIDTVIENLRDAPDDHGLVERWNWWMGALELAHGGFERFRIHRYADVEEGGDGSGRQGSG